MGRNHVLIVDHIQIGWLSTYYGPFTPKIFYIGWTSDRIGSYTIHYSIHTHQMQKGWRLDLDRIKSAKLTKKIYNTT